MSTDEREAPVAYETVNDVIRERDILRALLRKLVGPDTSWSDFVAAETAADELLRRLDGHTP